MLKLDHLNFFVMKYSLITIALLVLLTACKKSTVVEQTVTHIQNEDTTSVSTTIITTNATATDWDARLAKAEADLMNAKAKVKEAAANGDANAKIAAQKTADDAQTAWNNLKFDPKLCKLYLTQYNIVDQIFEPKKSPL